MIPYTEAEDNLIKLLRSQGVPAVEIAQRLNVQFHNRRTKLSVLGRARRIGCAPITRDEQGLNGKIQTRYHNDGNYTKPVAIPVNTGEGISILSLTENTCRYITDDEKRLYCGCKIYRPDNIKTRQSYCKKHREACFQKNSGVKLHSV